MNLSQFLNSSNLLLTINPILLTALILWSLTWKGFALWKSARLSHKKWFIIMLVANTAGILEIVYLFFVAKKYSVVTESEN